MLHRYQLNGYNIVLDVHSGAVHVLDTLSYDLLGQLSPPLGPDCPQILLQSFSGQYPREALEEAYAELYTLYEDGLLFSGDDYAGFAADLASSPVKAMCLHIAHDCNLRCTYCFAAQGDFGQGRKLMSLETGKQALDFLVRRSEGRRNLEVDFFGGEPLMNFEVVKALVAYGRSLEPIHNKRFRFTLTTNGLLLDPEIMAFLNAEMSNLVLSIDGRKEVNDRLRTRVGGQGCYDTIVPRYQKLVADRGEGQYYVRGTYTKYNLDFSRDVMHLNELGFDQISVEPVVGEDTVPYAITEKDLPEIYAEYEKMASLMIDKKRAGEGFNFFHFMLDLDQGPCAIKRMKGCGAGNEYVAVTPEGDIYPCHQFVGMENWKMGSVHTDTLDTALKTKFANTHIYTKPICKDCWAKFYCSGGCNAANFQYMGDIATPHTLSCELQKKRLECAIMIKAAL